MLGIYFDATSPNNTFIKTDVGGAYRRFTAPDGSFSWKPLLDWVTPTDSSMYSVSSLALFPASGSSLYLLLGDNWEWARCTVLFSDDAGDSWRVAAASTNWSLKCGGNGGDRMFGERMAVHPVDVSTLAVGGTDGGVYVSNDGFGSLPAPVRLPSPASASPCDPTKSTGCVVRTVAWVSPPSGSDGPTLLLAAIPSVGFFVAEASVAGRNGSWVFVAGSSNATVGIAGPFDIARIAVLTRAPAAQRRLWVTTAVGGVWSGVLTPSADNSSWAMDWDVRGALADVGAAFNALAVAPDGSDVIAVTSSTSSNTTLWRSTDAGMSFTRLNWTSRSSVPWWGSYQLALNAAAAAAFDPHAGVSAPSLWVTDYFGVWHADVFTRSGPSSSSTVSTATSSLEGSTSSSTTSSTSTLQFVNEETGHEEVCVNFIKSPLVGPLLSGAADVGGWRHDGGTLRYPNATFSAHDGQHNCAFGADCTQSLNAGATAPDALWVTMGDEYGFCRNGWCGLHRCGHRCMLPKCMNRCFR